MKFKRVYSIIGVVMLITGSLIVGISGGIANKTVGIIGFILIVIAAVFICILSRCSHCGMMARVMLFAGYCPYCGESLYEDESGEDEIIFGQQIDEFEKQKLNEKECPFCAEIINSNAVFCEFCGCNVQEKERETKEMRQRELKERGFYALFDDEDFMNQANEIRRVYGKNVYISYIKDKAKELGMGDIDLTEEDVE